MRRAEPAGNQALLFKSEGDLRDRRAMDEECAATV